MKKFVAIMMMLAMMASFCSVYAFAEKNFVNSVINNDTPEIIHVDYEEIDGCHIIVTSYADRANLPDGGAMLESALNQLTSADSVSGLIPGLPNNSKVFTIFDVRCDKGHKNHAVTLTLKFPGLRNFVTVLHNDGGWINLAGSTANGEEVTFSTPSLSPFAVIVSDKTMNTPVSAQTGESVNIAAIAASAVLFCAAGFFFIKGKKADA